MKRADLSVAEVLGSMPWFLNLPEAVRVRVAEDSFDTLHRKGSVISHAGDSARSWLGVASGMLKISAVYRSGKAMMFTGVPAGSWVGEGSVMKKERRRYEIVAMADTRVIHVPGSTFRWLLDTNIEFTHFIMAHLNERLAQYISMVESDRLTNPVARLARAIANLYNPVLYPKMGAMLQISQMEFGELAGISRQSTNAGLKELEQRGLLRTDYGRVFVIDLMALREFADGDD